MSGEREEEHHHKHHGGRDALGAIAGGLAGAYAGSHLSKDHKGMGGALGALGGALLGEKLAEGTHKHHGHEYRDDGPAYNNPPPPMNNMGYAPQDQYYRDDRKNNDYQYERRGGPAHSDSYDQRYDEQTYGRPPQGYPGPNQGRQGW
ncbi:hypothetical protein RNJ44_01660 [Nakaseomyces bracarensis]|uniref:Glycine zipper 2TM domain-containing protein n=1 Tax=Nakaseomyces bracarensis TaxID=273131 RepID=A0ABR4NNE8_9SACH